MDAKLLFYCTSTRRQDIHKQTGLTASVVGTGVVVGGGGGGGVTTSVVVVGLSIVVVMIGVSVFIVSGGMVMNVTDEVVGSGVELGGIVVVAVVVVE